MIVLMSPGNLLCKGNEAAHDQLTSLPQDVHNKLIDSLLGPIQPSNSSTVRDDIDADECTVDYDQALANLITDVDIASTNYSNVTSQNTARAVLKDLQPHHEQDRRRRFAAAELIADSQLIQTMIYTNMTIGL